LLRLKSTVDEVFHRQNCRRSRRFQQARHSQPARQPAS